MKKAFTLAEVLITLGVIGIVAALTMPALIANYQTKVTVTKLKKFYSVMSQAFTQAELEYGDPTGWDLIDNNDPDGAKNMAEKFRPYLRVVSEEAEKVAEDNGSYVFYLADGSAARFAVRSADCTSNRGSGRLQYGCGVVSFATKPENRQDGINHFSFSLVKDGIIPNGTPESTGNVGFATASGCLGTTKASCTAWVLQNENMEYLKCDDLSWDGKTKCD